MWANLIHMKKKLTFKTPPFLSGALSYLRNLSIAKKKKSSAVSFNKAPVPTPVKKRKKSPAYSGEGVSELGIGA